MKDNKTVQVSVTIPRESLAKLKAKAKLEGRSVSNMLSWLIENEWPEEEVK